MAKREISEGQRAWLTAEMASWQAEGVFGDDQKDRVLALYVTPEESSRRQHSSAMFALTAVAAFCVGLAALLLIGYNWEAMPKPAKLAVVFGVIGTTHGAGFWLRYHRRSRGLSEVVFFLGCFFYGCGIWLVAQIFNIQGHYPNALWIWALGTLPFALCLDTLLLHALVVALLAAWVGTEILSFDTWFWGRLRDACYTLPVLALPGLVWAYRKRSPAAVGLYVALLAWWVILQPIAWQSDVNALYFIGAVGALFLAIASSHRLGSPMSAPYRLYGVLLAAGVLSILSFGDVIRSLLQDAPSRVDVSLVTGCLIGAIGLGAVLLADRFGPHSADTDRIGARAARFVGAVGRQAVPAALMLLMAGLCIWVGLLGTHNPTSHYDASGLDRWTAAVIVPTLVTNAALMAFAVWLIRSGLREDRAKLFGAGVSLFLLWAVFRYVDLFAGVGGMLGASLLFFACGAALFGMARYWAQRKGIRHA